MEKGFSYKVDDNVAVRIWSEKTEQGKGDSLAEGYMSELWDFTCISVTQNNLQELKEIWDQRDDEIKAPWMIPDEVLYRCDSGYGRLLDMPLSLYRDSIG
ncbi:hypothetical protein Gotri_000098 [Gossypium trilobum]|uniref:Uncharacterized protein n=1 Tax=Gossypium trilobum TaxID=34281 RepID=A0A7J9FYE0_9ROSI|nr:hypothetical protein [Gossypium trilobum]